MFATIKILFSGPIERQERHYHIIDVARGLAACVILFWHYQHFIALGMAAPDSRQNYPLYSLFWLFYEHGGSAVQLFWIISGFVFAAVYASSGVSARAFFEHRFARLYPLHFLTLIVVAVLQYICILQLGRALIYPQNDAYSFILHLFMASGWGIGGEASFNAPIWSVSAEVLIYALFWVSLRFLFRWGIVVPLVASIGFFLLSRFSPIAACGAYFFLGCAIFVFHRTQSITTQFAAAFAAMIMFAALLALGAQGLAILFLFSALTLASAGLEDFSPSRFAANIPWLADNTYGVYLWHIPVQLGLLLILSALGVSRAVAFSPWFLILFLVVVFVLARMSFLIVEKPMRNLIRAKLGKSRAANRGTLDG